MRATSIGIWVVGAGLLLGAGTASASDFSGDTGGAPPPEASAAVRQATLDAVSLGAPARRDDAWAGDTGGAPPPTAQERRDALAPPAATRLANVRQLQFTDRG